MGKYDRCMKAYLQDKRRFADLFNGSCFQGRQVIRAEDLEEASENYVATEEKLSLIHISKDQTGYPADLGRSGYGNTDH